MDASEELRDAATSYRAAAASPRDAALADLLEEAARKAAVREAGWQLAGYSPAEQQQLAESWWRNELAVARGRRVTH